MPYICNSLRWPCTDYIALNKLDKKQSNIINNSLSIMCNNKIVSIVRAEIVDVCSNCLLVLGSKNGMNRTFFGVGSSRFFTWNQLKNITFTQKVSSTNKKGEYGTN